MSFQVGFLRFDKARYASYTAHFKDIAGVSKKAEVKIAGVKVGWVDSVQLESDGSSVKAELRVLKKYALYQDSQATVKQEGILGGKFVEIVPGNDTTPRLKSGQTLCYSPRESVSMDDLMQSFKKISQNVEDVTRTLKEACIDTDGSSNLKNTLGFINDAARKIACISNSLDNLITPNQESMQTIIQDIRSVAAELKNQLPELCKNITCVSDNINNTMLPHIQASIEQVASSIELATDQLTNGVCTQAEQALATVNCIAQKINQGEGTIGQLVNDTAAYENIQHVVSGLGSAVNTLKNLTFAVDSHLECLKDVGSKTACKDFKLYANGKIQYNNDLYLLGGATYSTRGFIKRDILQTRSCDLYGNTGKSRSECFEFTKQHLDSLKLNLQLGKIYKNAAFRLGIFEGTLGLAVEYAVPFGTRGAFLTSFEAFDLRGQNRLYCDRRPHLKWLNKIYIGSHAYLAFGIDDFVSKYNKSGFIGAGVTLW